MLGWLIIVRSVIILSCHHVRVKVLSAPVAVGRLTRSKFQGKLPHQEKNSKGKKMKSKK